MYTVKSGEQYAKITITDAETVKFSDKWDVFAVKGEGITVKLAANDSGDGVYSTDDLDGSVIIAHNRRLDTMYLTGTGDVIVWAGSSAVDCPFKSGAKGGGSGGGCNYKGTTTTAIENGSTTNPITIDGESYTAVFGDIVVYGYTEFVFDGSVWSEFGRPFDTTPTSGSANAVTSDGIYQATPLKRDTGLQSVVGGDRCSASGSRAIAIGYGCVASASRSIALNESTKATQQNMTALGVYNSPRDGDLLNIGNGDSSVRSNILEANSTSVNINGDIQRDGVGIDDYTTTERKIGKWIDGSDLYQRTFEVTGLVNEQFNNAVLGTSGIDIKDVYGYIEWTYDSAPNVRTSLDYSINTNDYVALHNAFTDINIKPNRSDPGFAITKAVITIKYTKPAVQANLMQTPTPTEEVSETPTVEEDDMR